jgi:glycosyltransferase involved in cell wall biosynthesis
MRILALPRYGRLGASSRLRTFQYLPWLRRAGIDVQVQCLFEDEYVRSIYINKIAWRSIIFGYLKRVSALLASRSFDAVFVEKEALPWISSAIELGLLPRRVRLVLDYDDAVFHRYDNHRLPMVRRLLGGKLDELMRRADLVTVGNDYLGSRATAAGSVRVERLPTVIDLDRYVLSQTISKDEREIVVGWIGSPSTAGYLRQISGVMSDLSRRYRIQCVAIGSRPDQLIGTPFVSAPWHEDTEVASIRGFDIGIMPLPDAPWERGKCGYKLIQYMACGLPVVASRVGANHDIVNSGENGFLAEGDGEWTGAIERLILDTSLRARMGAAGRRRVEDEFCLQVQGPRLAHLLLNLMAS